MNIPRDINPRHVKLIVVRKDMKLSKPCEKCMGVIRSSGIRNVYYSNNGRLEKCYIE